MSTLVKLSQMVDLAVGSPEPGALNLNILHSLLHVIISKVHIEDTHVEFRGPDSDRLETCLAAASKFPQTKLSQYVLHQTESTDIRDKSDMEEGETKIKSEKGEREKKSSKSSASAKKGTKESPKSSGTTVIVVQNNYDSDTETTKPGSSASSRASPTKALEKRVIKLQSDVDAMINYQPPVNKEMLSAARQGADQKPVADMWEMMKFAKRMDAAETGINKLATLIDDVAKTGGGGGGGMGVSTLSASNSPHAEHKKHERAEDEDDVEFEMKRVDSIERRLWNIENRVGITERRLSSVAGGLNITASSEIGLATLTHVDSGAPITGTLNLDNLTPEQAMRAICGELAKLRHEIEKQKDATKDVMKMAKKIPFAALMDGVKHIEELKNKVGGFMTDIGDDAGNLVMKGEHDEMKSKLNDSVLQLSNIDSSFNTQMERFQEQLTSIEKEMGAIHERLNSTVVGGSEATAATDFGDYNELYGKIQTIENVMEEISNKASSLTEEKDEREMHVKALIEQIELLKTVKADKEDLDEALADKADQSMVNRKVSHDQFDLACDDLSKGLEEALLKLTQQEVLWSGALDDVQREVENKLDKIEISPLKDFVNSKLKLLQERLKTLSALRKETEAAGTKHKMLRNVNCLSCDKDVVMRTDDKGRTVPAEVLPPTRSMRPYLAYELDAVRRQQRRLPGARNMNHFENAVQEQQARGKCRDRDHMGKAVDHLCNRYCGGSHTTTTPQQRVTRMGHFLNQFGPEVTAIDCSIRNKGVGVGDGVKSPRISVVGQVTVKETPERSSMSSRRESLRKPSNVTGAPNTPTTPTAPKAGTGTPPKVASPPGSPRKTSMTKTPPMTPPPTAESVPEEVTRTGSKLSAVLGERKGSNTSKISNLGSRKSSGERRTSGEKMASAEMKKSPSDKRVIDEPMPEEAAPLEGSAKGSVQEIPVVGSETARSVGEASANDEAPPTDEATAAGDAASVEAGPEVELVAVVSESAQGEAANAVEVIDVE